MSSSASRAALAPEPLDSLDAAPPAGGEPHLSAPAATPFPYGEAVALAGKRNFPLVALRSSSPGPEGSANDPAAQAAVAEREARMREAVGNCVEDGERNGLYRAFSPGFCGGP